MKKVHALCLFLGLILVMVFYVARCARSFVLKPSLEFRRVDDPVAEKLAARWYQNCSDFDSPEFTWSQCLGALMKGLRNPVIVSSEFDMPESEPLGMGVRRFIIAEHGRKVWVSEWSFETSS